MSPCKPARDVKVHVPRHNSQRIGPAGTTHVEVLARSKRMRVDVRQTAFEPTSAIAQAIENASDWNSLLMTARADRGPQWDVGTQQFLVDEYSELYYNPTPLQTAVKAVTQEDGDEPATPGPSTNPSHNSERQRQQQHHMQDFSNSPRPSRSSHLPPNIPTAGTPSHHPNQYFPGSPAAAMASPRHGYPGTPQGMSFNGNGIPPTQFYGNSMDGSPASPMRMGGGMNMGMNMGMGGMGMGMGMQPDAMGSPDVRRRMTRGMSGEDYGGMH